MCVRVCICACVCVVALTWHGVQLRARFVPERDVASACDFFTRDVILASWSRLSTTTTWFYDVFQAMQNQISY